jgi:hypothetical protein
MKTAKTPFAFAFLLSVVLLAVSPDSPTIKTVAGNGTKGFSGDGGSAFASNNDFLEGNWFFRRSE